MVNNHRSADAIEPATRSNDRNINVAPGVIQDRDIQKQKRTNQRYCKLCGSAIDFETKKCTGCGKQYFRNPLKISSLVSLVTVLILIYTLATTSSKQEMMAKEIEYLNTKIIELESTLAEKERLIEDYEDQINDVHARLEKLDKVVRDNFLEGDSIWDYITKTRGIF